MKLPEIFAIVGKLTGKQSPAPAMPPLPVVLPPPPAQVPVVVSRALNLKMFWAWGLSAVVLLNTAFEIFYPLSPWRKVLHEIEEASGICHNAAGRHVPCEPVDQAGQYFGPAGR